MPQRYFAPGYHKNHSVRLFFIFYTVVRVLFFFFCGVCQSASNKGWMVFVRVFLATIAGRLFTSYVFALHGVTTVAPFGKRLLPPFFTAVDKEFGTGN